VYIVVFQQIVEHIFKKHTFFPYIALRVLAFFGNDPQCRIEFCIYFINKLIEDLILYRHVLCSDDEQKWKSSTDH
jgi:hypothetical protein